MEMLELGSKGAFNLLKKLELTLNSNWHYDIALFYFMSFEPTMPHLTSAIKGM